MTQRIADRERYYANKAKGICTQCGMRPVSAGSTIMCKTCRAKSNIRQTIRRHSAKKLVFDHYGWACSCPKCPEKDIRFSTIDHIDGGGRRHRDEIGFGQLYLWLVANDFPDGFQTLCFNCNTGKSTNGGTCPHLLK